MRYIGIYAKARHYCKVCLAASKDQLLKKYPDHKEAVEYFVQRAPNGNLKFVEWEMKVLTARQAMKEEIADVVDLFNKFNQKLEKKDIYQYQPQELAALREKLFAIREEQKNRQEVRQQKVEKRYQNEPEAIACGHKVVYDSDDLKCIQITNKAASMHYGMGTKWCITMKDQSYFEDYDKSNVVFFFLFNKHLDKSNPYYKVAFAYQRDTNNEIMSVENFDAEDNQFDSSQLAGKYAWFLRERAGQDKQEAINNEAEDYTKYMQELPQIYSMMLNIAKSYPKSLLARIYSNELSVDEVVKLYQNEPNKDIRSSLELWLIKNIDDTNPAGVKLVSDIARTAKTDSHIYHLAGSNSPEILDALLDGAMGQDGNVSYLHEIASNKALSPQSIEKIFKYMDSGGQIRMGTEDLQGTLLRNPNCPPDRLRYYAKTAQGIYLLEQIAKNSKAPADVINKMLNDEMNKKIQVPQFRSDLLKHPNASQDVLEQVFDKHHSEGFSIMANHNISPDFIRKIFEYWKPIVLAPGVEINEIYCRRLALNPNTPSDILEYVFNHMRGTSDQKLNIAMRLADHPNASPELIKDIREEFRVEPKDPRFGRLLERSRTTQ